MFAPPADAVSADTAFTSTVQLIGTLITLFVTVVIAISQRRQEKRMKEFESKLAVRDDETKQRNAALVKFQCEHALQLYDAYVELTMAWSDYASYGPASRYLDPPKREDFKQEVLYQVERARWENDDAGFEATTKKLAPALEALRSCFHHKRVFISEPLEKMLSKALRNINDIERSWTFTPEHEDVISELAGPIADEVRREIRKIIAPQKMITQE